MKRRKTKTYAPSGVLMHALGQVTDLENVLLAQRAKPWKLAIVGAVGGFLKGLARDSFEHEAREAASKDKDKAPSEPMN